jgi:hypothetical protein
VVVVAVAALPLASQAGPAVVPLSLAAAVQPLVARLHNLHRHLEVSVTQGGPHQGLSVLQAAAARVARVPLARRAVLAALDWLRQ